MSSIPPLSVTVNTKKRACVLDTHLVLSRYGLLLAQRLGEEFNLWLVRELWQILDNTQYYLSHPELLTPSRPGNKGSETNINIKSSLLREILRQWELARIETDMAGLKVFWIGDAMSESLLPTEVDQNLVYRFETLARSLDVRVHKQSHNSQNDNIFADCFRDAAALTSALISYRGFILTLQGHRSEDFPENEPIICSYLREWGIRCYRVGSDNKTKMEREFIIPIFARTGISELMWAGLNLAAVHIIVPEAIIIPPLRREDDALPEDLPLISEEKEPYKKDWWEGALCFWYPL